MPTVPASEWTICQGINRGLSQVTASTRVVNWYPEKNTGSNPKTPSALIGRPGYTSFATPGTGPVRGMFSTVSELYAVVGTHFYKIDPSSGATITDYGAMAGATASIAYPCQIVSNGTQILVCDTSTSNIFYANSTGPAMTLVHAGISVEFMNGFFYALTPGTVGTTRSTIYQSAFGDGTTWPALDYVDITTTADMKTRLIVTNNQLWVMGAVNCEVWSDAGTAGFVLALSSVVNQGIYGGNLGAACVARAGNTICWLGASSERGGLQFYRADGLTPVRISNPGVEALLSEYEFSSGSVGGAYSFTKLVSGHTMFVTNFAGAYNYNGQANGATIVYDLTTNEWHEESYITGGNTYQALPSSFASVIAISGGAPVNFVGAFNSGIIYIEDLNNPTDASVPIIFTAFSPHASNKNEWIPHNSLTIDGQIQTTPQVAISDDGGTSYGSFRDFLVQNSLAASGVKTYTIFSLGSSRDRVYRVQINGGIGPTMVSNCYLDIGPAGTQQ